VSGPCFGAKFSASPFDPSSNNQMTVVLHVREIDDHRSAMRTELKQRGKEYMETARPWGRRDGGVAAPPKAFASRQPPVQGSGFGRLRTLFVHEWDAIRGEDSRDVANHDACPPSTGSVA
jgi:hypothetical protein